MDYNFINELKNLCICCYKNRTYKDWKLATSYSDGSGLNVCVYTKPDKTVIAFRGTEKKDWDDYKSDAAMIRGHIPNQAYKAEQYYNLIKNKYKNVIFTGHSLGGTIAQYLNQQTNLPAYCFAPFGCKAINKLSRNCINLGYESDIIYNICLEYLRGNVYILPDPTWQGTYIKNGKIEPIAFSKRVCYPSIQKHQLETWGGLTHAIKYN